MSNNKLIFFVTGTVAFAYVLCRALLVDITYDEAWTIMDFTPMSTMDIISYKACDSNNHLLNTLLIKLFHRTIDSSLFVARLPNVLAFLLYIYFSFRLSKEFLPRLTGPCLYLLLLLNPFVLEFFSLARGYGIAMAFMMASIYYFCRSLNNSNRNDSITALIAACFSVLGSFTFLNYWLALFAVIHLACAKREQKTKLLYIVKRTVPIFLLFAAMLYVPLSKLAKNGKISYGGTSDIYHDTLLSLTSYSLNNPENIYLATLVTNIFLLLFVIVIGSSVTARRHHDINFSRGFLLLSMLFIILSANVAQFYLMHTPYPTDRLTMMHYIVIMIVFAMWAGNEQAGWKAFVAKGSMVITAAAIVVNFALHANIHKTTLWPFDSQTSGILTFLNEKGKQQQRVITLDSSWPFERGIRYYTDKKDLTCISYKEGSLQEGTKTDYYLHFAGTLERVDYQPGKEPPGKLEMDTVIQPGEGIILFLVK